MEVRIGIVNAPREVNLEMGDDTTIDEIKAAIEVGVANSSLIWLTDRRGRQTGFAGERVAYVELGAPGDDHRIGFS